MACVVAVSAAGPRSNMDNYDGSYMVDAQPLMQPIFVGMKMILTKNLNKQIGFVNGMGAVIQNMDRYGIEVLTEQNKTIMVHPWTAEDRRVHFPFRVGYASTLHKVQGATLEHVTMWLDVRNMPAAAYVAISRVRRDEDWRYIGNVCVHHFTPAQY